MTTTFDAIRAIIVRDFELPAERLQRDTLLEEIQLDSLAITELVFEIEDEFQITAGDKIPPFQTLGDIADYVARLIAERDTKPRVAAKNAAAPAIRAMLRRLLRLQSGPVQAQRALHRPARVPCPASGLAAREAATGSPVKARTAGARVTQRPTGSGRKKATRAAKRPARAAPSQDVPPAKAKAKARAAAAARALGETRRGDRARRRRARR